MKDYELKNIAIEDIEDLLVKIETSFDIKFGRNELAYITNFGQLCDHIENKIELNNSDNCTSQQAFYKVREAIVSTLHIEKQTITTSLLLCDLFPGKERISKIKKLEKHLGFKLNILSPSHWLTTTLLMISIVSFVGLFFSTFFGLGIVLSIVGFKIANKLGNELDLQTIKELVEKITRENYLKSRRNANTFNKKEIKKVLIDSFTNCFDLDETKLTRESQLF